MEGDPPLGECPSWCEREAGHDWEDQWVNGLIRTHVLFRVVDGDRFHRLGIQEIEQETGERMREIVLDVESPTNWGQNAALQGLEILGELVALATTDWPTGDVR